MDASQRTVDAALAKEAAKLNKAPTGIHRFDPIGRMPTLRDGCNWTAGFHVVGSRLPLEDMRDVLERVQARFAVVDFG